MSTSADSSGAETLPIKELESRTDDLPRDQRMDVYRRSAYCRVGDEAVGVLRERGIDAIKLDGGWPEWSSRKRASDNGYQLAHTVGALALSERTSACRYDIGAQGSCRTDRRRAHPACAADNDDALAGQLSALNEGRHRTHPPTP